MAVTKTRDGNVEAIRVLGIARRSAVDMASSLRAKVVPAQTWCHHGAKCRA